jgi:hypothetical protein
MKPGSPLVFIWNNEEYVLFPFPSFSSSPLLFPLYIPSHTNTTQSNPPYPQPLRRLESSLENDTPQQHRSLWEETFSTPAYKEFFQEPNGVRSRVEWKSEHSDEKVSRSRFVLLFCDGD